MTGLPANQPFVLYPAQFWPHKNHVVLLEALQLLKEKHSTTMHLVCTGSDQGNLAHVQQRCHALGLDGQVHFAGFVPQRTLAALYRDALALVYPSFFGPYNLPPLEAFAAGCPVIAARVAGAEEQLADAALLVDAVDEAAFASAIHRLLTDSEARGLYISRGRERVTHFTMQAYLGGIEAILNALALRCRCWDPRAMAWGG